VSYDIYFVRRDPGQSFEDALDSTEDSYASGDPGPLTSVELEQWDRVLPRARSILGEIEEFTGESKRELLHPSTGVQLSIFPGEISITVPDSHADVDAVALMEKVYALAHAVEAATGLEGYDPQLGEPIRDTAYGQSPNDTFTDEPEDDATGFHSGTRLRTEEFQAEQQAARATTRRWWEFWK
jgi:hypothetical protein